LKFHTRNRSIQPN